MHTAAVVPTSNDATTIEALLSALYACLEVTEVFVVDAASSDGTAALVADFRDSRWSRVHVVALREEASVGTALRVGFDLADQTGVDRVLQLGPRTANPASVVAALNAAAVRGADVAIASAFSLLDIETMYEIGRAHV